MYAQLTFVTTRHHYVTHIVLNAGSSAFTGINWLYAVWMMMTSFHAAVTYPQYKLQRAGDVGKDGYGWVWQANLGAHYVLVGSLSVWAAQTATDFVCSSPSLPDSCPPSSPSSDAVLDTQSNHLDGQSGSKRGQVRTLGLSMCRCRKVAKAVREQQVPV